MNRRAAVADGRVLRSSGNVFVDLESDRPGEKKTKINLAVAINQNIRARKLTQDQAGRSLRITQPKVSALANYRLGGFSVERLMQFLNALGCGVEIVVHKPGTRRVARTVVTAEHRQDR